MNIINKEWDKLLENELEKDYFKNIINNLQSDYKNKTIFPEKNNIFKALQNTSFNNIKVVIIGQDPYHEIGQAMGLSFSVPNNIKAPPSLRNIFKELNNDLGINNINNDLTSWSKQGVLLLNSILTVEEGKPLSHKKYNWELFTNNIIKLINDNKNNVVFILWGNYAKEKKSLITNKTHYIIESNHPSPLSASRGFFNSKPFSKTNNFLKEHNIEEIDWRT